MPEAYSGIAGAPQIGSIGPYVQPEYYQSINPYDIGVMNSPVSAGANYPLQQPTSYRATSYPHAATGQYSTSFYNVQPPSITQYSPTTAGAPGSGSLPGEYTRTFNLEGLAQQQSYQNLMDSFYAEQRAQQQAADQARQTYLHNLYAQQLQQYRQEVADPTQRITETGAEQFLREHAGTGVQPYTHGGTTGWINTNLASPNLYSSEAWALINSGAIPRPERVWEKPSTYKIPDPTAPEGYREGTLEQYAAVMQGELSPQKLADSSQTAEQAAGIISPYTGLPTRHGYTWADTGYDQWQQALQDYQNALRTGQPYTPSPLTSTPTTGTPTSRDLPATPDFGTYTPPAQTPPLGGQEWYSQIPWESPLDTDAASRAERYRDWYQHWAPSEPEDYFGQPRRDELPYQNPLLPPESQLGDMPDYWRGPGESPSPFGVGGAPRYYGPPISSPPTQDTQPTDPWSGWDTTPSPGEGGEWFPPEWQLPPGYVAPPTGPQPPGEIIPGPGEAPVGPPPDFWTDTDEYAPPGGGPGEWTPGMPYPGAPFDASLFRQPFTGMPPVTAPGLLAETGYEDLPPHWREYMDIPQLFLHKGGGSYDPAIEDFVRQGYPTQRIVGDPTSNTRELLGTNLQVSTAPYWWRDPNRLQAAEDYLGFLGAPATPVQEGMVRYQVPEMQNLGKTFSWMENVVGDLTKSGQQVDSPEWWQEYWRTFVGSSLGLEPGLEPTDPLAQLESQLLEAYDPNKVLPERAYDFSQALTARQAGLAPQLQQRAAGMGIQGAFDPLQAEQMRSNVALAEQAAAEYLPAAYQARKEIQQETEALYQMLNKAELEARLAYTGAGV